MLYEELLALTDERATYEEYCDINTVYMGKETMTKAQAAALWRRRYAPKKDKPRPDEMRRIKREIHNLWDEHDFAVEQVKRVSASHRERIEQYKKDNSWQPESYLLETVAGLERQRANAIYDVWDMYGNDITIQLIYEDGSELNVSGIELVGHDVKPKMQHIAYAYFISGYEEYDTLSGDLDWGDIDDDATVDEWCEIRNRYFNRVQMKYGTEWAKKMEGKVTEDGEYIGEK